MRVFLVDSQPVFREGLKTILASSRNNAIAGEADTCRELIEHLNSEAKLIDGEWDLIILDGEMDSLTFLRTFEKTRTKGRRPYTLVLTRHTDDRHALQMLSAGADGYVNKSESPELILEAIRKVSRGENYVSRKLAETVLFNMTRDNGPVRLSSREYQVLYLFGSGLGTKQIAGQLDLSVKTISTYRYRLLEKLKLTTNAQLMRYAITEGVLSD